MTSSTRLSTMESIYNKRAPTYDDEAGFHPTQAADYLTWMDLKPGHNVLDLACGTGAITLPAARLVGASGKVVGVDISAVSLSIANSKAEKDDVKVTFIQHDIAALDGLEGIQEGSFDVISCASAFVLLEDYTSVLKGWARLLKVGGKVIFDVPAQNSMIGIGVLNAIGHKFDMPCAYDRTPVNSVEKLKALLLSAGLNGEETFISQVYSSKELEVKDAGDLFESIVERKGWFEDVYAGFRDPTVKASAKEMFCQELERIADDGKTLEEMKLIMAVGRNL